MCREIEFACDPELWRRETIGYERDTISEFDTATAHGNGFKFGPYTAEALLGAVDRALDAYRRPADWRRVVRNGMACDFSWRHAAERYLDVYRSLLASPRA